MPRWSFSLFGLPTLSRSGSGPISISNVYWSIIGFLMTCPKQRAPRSAVAGTLWPDHAEEAARHCLSTAMWRLRRAIAHPSIPISAEGEIITLANGAWIDAVAFERKAAPRSTLPLDTARKLRSALRLYRGDYLMGFDADWLILERERLRCLYLDTLYALVHAEATAGNWQAVVKTAQRLCIVEPLREDGHRMLMEGYARTGNRALALRQFRVCCNVLERELGVDPMPETIALERRLAGGLSGQALQQAECGMRESLVAARESIGQALDVVDRALKRV